MLHLGTDCFYRQMHKQITEQSPFWFSPTFSPPLPPPNSAPYLRVIDSVKCRHIFDLALEFVLWFVNFNLTNFFSTVSAWVFIFILHMNIPCCKIFFMLLNLLTLKVDIFQKMDIIFFKIINIRAFILHISIPCDMIFMFVSTYLFLWPWPSLGLAIIWDLYVLLTHFVKFFINIFIMQLICDCIIDKCWYWQFIGFVDYNLIQISKLLHLTKKYRNNVSNIFIQGRYFRLRKDGK